MSTERQGKENIFIESYKEGYEVVGLPVVFNEIGKLFGKELY